MAKKCTSASHTTNTRTQLKFLELRVSTRIFDLCDTPPSSTSRNLILTCSQWTPSSPSPMSSPPPLAPTLLSSTRRRRRTASSRSTVSLHEGLPASAAPSVFITSHPQDCIHTRNPVGRLSSPITPSTPPPEPQAAHTLIMSLYNSCTPLFRSTLHSFVHFYWDHADHFLVFSVHSGTVYDS